ncbi:hypothetical protein B5X24_HaOG202825 [Helicoverpa armigera]|nr:hypothetical protein B5X24_HaOG202825 [Helicoverpa armigera]
MRQCGSAIYNYIQRVIVCILSWVAWIFCFYNVSKIPATVLVMCEAVIELIGRLTNQDTAYWYIDTQIIVHEHLADVQILDVPPS